MSFGVLLKKRIRVILLMRKAMIASLVRIGFVYGCCKLAFVSNFTAPNSITGTFAVSCRKKVPLTFPSKVLFMMAQIIMDDPGPIYRAQPSGMLDQFYLIRKCTE